jgi:DNA-binding MarR family transcriptional regulator
MAHRELGYSRVVYPPRDLPGPSTERLQLLHDADLVLLSIAERLRQHWATHAAAIGLSPAQVRALLTMTPGEAFPMRYLAARLDYDASNLSTLVDRLEHRGLVERRANPVDRRIRTLVLTEAGEKLRADFWHNLVEDPGPLAPLGDSELRALIGPLSAIAEPALP